MITCNIMIVLIEVYLNLHGNEKKGKLNFMDDITVIAQLITVKYVCSSKLIYYY